MSSPLPDSELDEYEEAIGELVDGELYAVATPIDDGPTTLAGQRSVKTVAVQAAAVATTGFVAGAIATAVVAHRSARSRRRWAPPKGLDVVDSQRFLVDVHQLRPRGR
ncbi:hypothetical protein [Patulibacter defluvii]|uniref:hypothetical protein n=1 Tax=Patulibacter defluvii TaxID=3095358 RepID=UPI002A75C973|nr:hypothetical protein [Patulibacter sp. DM4]